MKIVAVIPAYNEERSISEVVSDTKQYVDEVLVIDDGSTDKTAEKAKNAGATVISNVINRGLGITIKRGYNKALKMGAGIVIQIDADGQYSTKDIPKLIEPIKNDKADIVLASRFRGGIEEMPFGKRAGNKISTIVTRLASGFPTSDAQTGFRAIRKELLEEIQPSGKYTYVQEMIIRASKEGWRIKEVPSFFKKRKSGSSRLIPNIFTYAKEVSLIIIQTIRDYHPLVFFGGLGFILLIAGGLIGLDLINMYLRGVGIEHRMGSVILSAFLMTFGVLLIFVAMLADMIQLKYEQLRDEFRRIEK